jgi:hypothetical protein
MPSADELTALATAQAALVRSLTVAAPSPAGFDPQAVAVSARALRKKRVRTVTRVWPRLAEALGETFEEQFLAYAQQHPLPRQGGPLADGRRFVQYLQEQGKLPDAGRWEAFAVDLHHVLRPDGLHPRTGLFLRLARFPQLRWLALAIRLPWLGGRILTLPYGRGHHS